MTKVKCVAENCVFWLPGNYCDAGHIDVTNNQEGRAASTVDETICLTFAAREPEIQMNPDKNKLLENLLTDDGKTDAGIHPEVRCIVDSCEYWGKGDSCLKDHIGILYKESTKAVETACEDYEKREH
ncbi:DUF1540 domain-containing protein [Aneurinibacillus sp. Ricciae_BoGa-3]|uniref:DUF1540 domain-containing protein n=1 Tax=Aneurinibacillus sp. Ricciae_BoGa-3 TaxID=3022697 RepID=UPI003FA432CE